LFGKCAVANAKLAYQRFKETASSPRWHSLEGADARPQRLLWASTSTKNPSYDDLMYVEPLIGAQTINTLPSKTITVFAHHGKATATLEQGLDEAQQLMGDLKKTGIDLPRVTEQLLDEGIEKFNKAFDEILQTIADKAERSGAR
jgi:transaldolase